MNPLIIDIVTKQPVLVSALDGDPNSANSFGYIPGGVLRGAIISRYLQRQGSERQLDPREQPAQHLFFSNQVRFLHAYPVDPVDETRMLPTIQKLKPATKQVSSSDEEKAKEPKYEWLGSQHIFDTVRHLNIHTTRNRAKGRSLRGSGAVYRYVAIAPNQRFRAIILGDEASLDCFQQLLLENSQLWLGKARSAGYGAVLIERVELFGRENHATDWQEWPYEPASQLPTSETVTMTLLSDAIIRDQYGQYARIGVEPTAPEFAPAALAASFGLHQGRLNLAKSKLRYTVLGGFNRTWGLPLPQTSALAAGSVLVWEQARADWPTLIEHGIGERRNEGFGRISFADNLQNHVIKLTATDSLREPKPSLLLQPAIKQPTTLFAAEAAKLLQQMGDRLLRQRLDQALIDMIGTYQIKQQLNSRNSLFGRVELWCRELLAEIQALAINQTTEVSVEVLLDALHAKVNQTAQIARQHLRATSLSNNQSLETLLKTKQAELLTLWQIPPLQFGDQLLQLTPQLAVEYHARLIIAIVTMARKQPLLKKRG
ncbi:hypothetical protein [Herpetosiphon giganteus]|uniref:hypothetical protein n=1 Tax=Herpetosiphon giganteus TaxID=2029754 RepID=UPI00195ACD06|nr:hypothetical protein [Herpetosiphon giganteus]MBM7844805.1 CRISPR-associated protein Csx10 [Herpetosiphon giganteus]